MVVYKDTDRSSMMTQTEPSGDFSLSFVELEENEERADNANTQHSSDPDHCSKDDEHTPLLPTKDTASTLSSSAPSPHDAKRKRQSLLMKSVKTLVPLVTEPKPRSQDSPNHSHRTVVSPEFRRRRYERRKQLFSCFLSALSGFADILCHHSFGCYGNMMTGNTISLMDHLSAGRFQQATYPGALVPSYIIGAALFTYLSKLDLTHLGLGGPSQEAFAHLNPPRRLRSPQQISVLRVVALASMFLFILGEGLITLCHCDQRWRLPIFACAFGLLNAATLAAIHLVTNAVTGHWITVGLGVADDLPVLLNRQSSGPLGGSSYRVPEEIQPPQTAAQKRWKSSMSVAAAFIGSIIFTSIAYNEYLREKEHHPDWLLPRFVDTLVPPMGIVFAILYTGVLYWYTLPPPYLHGYSSSVDLASM